MKCQHFSIFLIHTRTRLKGLFDYFHSFDILLPFIKLDELHSEIRLHGIARCYFYHFSIFFILEVSCLLK